MDAPGLQIALGVLGAAAGGYFTLHTFNDHSRSVLAGTGLRDSLLGLLCGGTGLALVLYSIARL